MSDELVEYADKSPRDKILSWLEGWGKPSKEADRIADGILAEHAHALAEKQREVALQLYECDIYIDEYSSRFAKSVIDSIDPEVKT